MGRKQDMVTREFIQRHRNAILEIARRYGARGARIFGVVALPLERYEGGNPSMRPDRFLLADMVEAVKEVIETTPPTGEASDADKLRGSHILRHRPESQRTNLV